MIFPTKSRRDSAVRVTGSEGLGFLSLRSDGFSLDQAMGILEPDFSCVYLTPFTKGFSVEDSRGNAEKGGKGLIL